MKMSEAERSVKAALGKIYPEGEAQSIASLELEHLTLLSKGERLLRQQESLSPQQQVQLEADLLRLLRHEPVQYVMNKAWFYGMALYVDKNVLIPRPETEELVEWIIQEVRGSGKAVFGPQLLKADDTRGLKIMDVGTGSGCIALALKKAMPGAEVWGCDRSEEALTVARRNGASLDIRVDFQGCDFLDNGQQKQLPTVDIVVSNPPYIPLHNSGQMDANVLAYEPHAALFVPDDDALVFYRALAHFGKHRLKRGGGLYMEIHEDLGKEVLQVFEKEGYVDLMLKKDMQGKDRMVRAVAPA
ncbi:MAG: peptide chain release factor N(5)-glutamine methyltransferase [Flavisolibacter sp.]